MAKTGRPTKYTKKILEDVVKYARIGLTDDQMAAIVGVTRSTFYKWKNDFPEFSDALIENKKIVDAKVVRALFERATGYEHEDTHISNYQGEITETKTIKHYPPDPTSMIFWLKNRDKDNWREKPNTDEPDKDVNVKITFND
jgi:DNA-binding XRE family transcriptional regulator